MELGPLLDAGLTQNEAEIYIVLLSGSGLSAGDITKKTGVHRRNVYDALNRLLEKGLINEIECNNKKQFNALNPTVLLKFMEGKKRAINSILPKLQSRFNATKKSTSVRLYKGIGGIKSGFSESLELLDPGEEVYIIGCINMPSLLGPFMRWHHEERVRKKIKTYSIFNASAATRAKQMCRRKNYTVRVLPEKYPLPVQTVIYGDKAVCQMLIHDEPFVIQTIDSAFAKNYQKHFRVWWELSTDAKEF